MSLRRRAKRSETVDGRGVRPALEAGTVPEAPPAPSPAPAPEVEPLGEAARGRRSAREAFLADAGGGAGESAPGPEASPDAAPTAAGDEAPNALSWEQLGELAATLVDVGGRVVGPMATRRDRADVWPLTPDEKTTVATHATPVLKQYLGDAQVTPLAALAGVLVALYLPRTLAALSAPPASQSTVEAPPAPPAPAPAPAQVEQPSPERAVVTPGVVRVDW